MKRFIPLGFKLTAASVVLILSAAAGIYTQLTRLEYRNSVQAKSAALRMVSELFVQSVAAPLVFGDEAGVTENINFLKKNPDVDAVDVWSGAEASTRTRLQSYRRTPGAELARPAARPSALEVRVSADALVLEQAIKDVVGQPIGVAAIRFSLARENAAHRSLSQRILYTSLGVAAGLSLLLWLVSRLWIVRPLRQLGHAAQALQRGERVRASEGAPSDEIGRLARTFDEMADTLSARSQALAARTAEMKRVLDNVEQGFLTLDLQGVVGAEWSAVLARWFGAPPADARFAAWLGAADERFRAHFVVAWEQVREGALPVACSLDQLPRLLNTAQRNYELAYIPVLGGPDRLEKVVVVVSDITAERSAARAAQFQSDVLSAAGKLVQDPGGFESFASEAGALLQRVCDAQLPPLEVARALHTLKGNAGVFGLHSIAHLCHELETAGEDGDSQLAAAQRALLQQTWQTLLAQLAPLIAGRAHAQLDVSADELERLIEQVRAGLGRPALAAQLESFRLERAGAQLGRLAERAAQLAVRLGRERPELVLEGGELRLDGERFAPLWSALVHCVRNSVDHGLEPAQQRLAAGKLAQGSLTFAARKLASGIEIEIADDGRGLDWGGIAAKARARGLPASTQAELQDALFADGVSTRDQVTDVSGRGVGLSAVRAVVQELGGEVVVESAPGRGTRFRCRIPHPRSVSRLSAPPLPRSSAAP